jgi:hypothetical protein
MQYLFLMDKDILFKDNYCPFYLISNFLLSLQVEMFGVTANETKEESSQLMMEILDIQKELYAGLGLHFRYLE